jgi:hypothetical protein
MDGSRASSRESGLGIVAKGAPSSKLRTDGPPGKQHSCMRKLFARMGSRSGRAPHLFQG